jgi:5-hydroxyisourate hydrolase
VALGRPTISTHVLDTAGGAPAVGVRVRLVRGGRDGDDWSGVVVGDTTTDEDGRIADLLAGQSLERGSYRLEFLLGDGFFRSLSVWLDIDDPTRSYHVPLLRSPYGLTTYRGS